MKSITRTIEKTIVEAKAVKFEGDSIIGRDLPSFETAERIEKSKYNEVFESQLLDGEKLVIKDIKKEEKTFTVPVDEFIKLAETIERENEEAKKEIEAVKQEG